MRFPLVAVLLLGVTTCLSAPAAAEAPVEVPYPVERWVERPLDDLATREAVAPALDALFADVGPAGVSDTRALLVVHRGALVVERYADGFDATSRFRSWSMAKSVTQALIARLVHLGRLELDAPAAIPEWRDADDPRRAITLRHMLQMSSGLDNADGDLSPSSFIGRMLFGAQAQDMAAFAAKPALIHEPGTHWAYSTGTSMLLGRLISQIVGGGREGVIAFANDELAAPLGIQSLVIGFDGADNPLAGSRMWMTARDWARLGFLYVHDGVWNGRRLLPEGWTAFTRTRAPAANNGVYGAHFWLPGTPMADQFEILDPALGGYFMTGNGGQYVMVFPERDLVLVRLGEMHMATWGDLSREIGRIVAAFPELAP